MSTLPVPEPVSEIRADAQRAACTQCMAYPFRSCPGGTHIVRLHRALKRRMISAADYTTALLDPDTVPAAGIMLTAAGRP